MFFCRRELTSDLFDISTGIDSVKQGRDPADVTRRHAFRSQTQSVEENWKTWWSPKWEELNGFVTLTVCITELIHIFILFYVIRLMLWL